MSPDIPLRDEAIASVEQGQGLRDARDQCSIGIQYEGKAAMTTRNIITRISSQE